MTAKGVDTTQNAGFKYEKEKTTKIMQGNCHGHAKNYLTSSYCKVRKSVNSFTQSRLY